MFDILIVGAGFSGAVVARRMAEKHHKKVLILEKRPHIGGNMYEETLENGVRVHRYGPHIFHTRSREVFEYLQRFSDFYPYEHRVLGKIDGKMVPIPFNFTSLEELFPKKNADAIKQALKAAYPSLQKISILDLLKCPDGLIRAFGEYVYDRVFVHYTAKQWQQPIEAVDTSVINRVPVVLGYDDRYFQDEFQYMPSQGYTRLFENLLDHPNIQIKLNCDASAHLSLEEDTGRILFDGEPFASPVVYTGAPDVLLGCRFGALPYRSLRMVFEQLNKDVFQPAAVVNYPNEEDYTRITEFKHMTGQKIKGRTAILKEYPMAYRPEAEIGNIPYYPIQNPENQRLYQDYRNALSKFTNLHLCGRLAEYKYYNMDGAVYQALRLSERLAVL